jgi:flagellar hook assembly protein FlgD
MTTASTVQADIRNPAVALTSDANGDGIAGIGDTITLTCRSTTDDATIYVTSLPSLGFTQLPLVDIGNGLYSAIYTVSAGNVNSQIQFIFDDNSGSTQSVTTGFVLNSKRPSANGRPSTNRGTSSDGTFKKNDTLTITFKLNNSNNGETMYADLSALGLGYVDMGANANTFTCSVVMPANKEGTNLSFPVTAMNEAGNSVTWTSAAINYDTINPVVQSATAVNQTSNKQYVTVGDTIKIQAVISKWDNDIVTASNSLLFPGGPVTMEHVSGDTIGAMAVYEYSHPVTEENISNISTCFDITVMDDAENTVKKSTNYIRLDTLPPEFKTLSIKITDPVKGLLSNVAIIDDNLQIFGDMSSLMTDVTLLVDLSAIGGVSNQIIPFADGSTAPSVATTSFCLNYNVGQYTSEDNIPRAFTVTAKDIAGNIITQVTMPVIYVDNLPPTISAAQFINVTSANQPVKLGDQIAITASVGNPDNGIVYADISKLGGSDKAELSLFSGVSYRLDHVVSESINPMLPGGIDQSLSFVVYAQDNAGNIVDTTTGNLMVDTEPPLILNATYTVNPALSATHKFVKAGDRITFKVQLASSTSTVHDGETVTMDLSAFEGQSDNTELNYGGGWYTYSFDIPAGNLNFDNNFTAVAKDNAGNTVTRSIQVKIDNQKPVVGPIGINFLTDTAKTGVINIGDRIEIIVPVDDADEGYCYMDLSIIGSSSNCIIPYDQFDTALNRYYLVIDCKDAAIENPSYVFTANVYDKAGNKMSGISSPFVVDCRRPVCNDFSVTHIKKKGKSGVVNVGDQIKFTVEVDPSTFDNASVTVNLKKLGGSSAQKLEDIGDNIWTYTYTVEKGDTNGEDVLFKCKITDDAGNFVETNAPKSFFVDNCPVEIDSITFAQTTDTNGNDIVDLDGSFVVAPVYATDSVTLTVNLSANASVTVDLTKFGYNNTAYSIPVVTSISGYKAEEVIEPKKGSTNNEAVTLTVTATDENGNQTIMDTPNNVKVDNKPPEILVAPVTFTYDTGRQGEANKNDVIKIEANVTGNDGLAPLLDFTELYSANNMTPPGGTIMEVTPGSNKYSATFTVPEGLLSKNRLAIIAKDSSGNMTVAQTEIIRFISKIPEVNQTSVAIIDDKNSNGILNPGDTVRISCNLRGAFEDNNTPPTKVVVDIGGITDSDSNAFYTGDVENPEKRCWVELTWDGDSGDPYLYTGEFVASPTVKLNRGTDAESIDFIIRVLHPDSTTETMYTTTVTGEFPVDTKMPLVVNGSTKLTIVDENGDNTASYSANIGDFMEVKTEIKFFDDFASATAVLYMPNNGEILGYVPLVRNTGTDVWIGNFEVATGTRKAGEVVGENEWRIINEEAVKIKIFATDDADNTASSSLITPSPAIKIDNKPPQISTSHTETYIECVNTNADSWTGVNVWNGLATDSIHVKVTLTEGINATIGKGYAYIDLSPINGTSTYLLKPSTGANCTVFETVAGITYGDRYDHYISDSEVDLASYTFKIWVVDGAGNKNFFEDTVNLLGIDTKRPVVENMAYDGAMLTIQFSEPVQPGTIDVDNIRMGRANVSGVQSLHKDVDVFQGTAVKFSSTPVSADPEDYEKVSPLTSNSQYVSFLLGKTTKSKIADWGSTKLFLSIASMDDEPGQITDTTDINYKETGLGVDVANNWITPVLRGSPMEITISNEQYCDRPNLIGGRYNAASTNIDGDYLHLTFDKSMDKTTLTEDSISKLAIWYNNSSQSELWNVRYRMQPGSDTYDLGDTYNTSSCNADSVGIKLSQDAKDWIALTYGNRASEIRLQVNDSEYDPPAFIRDINGNRINAILPGYSIAASLTPLVSPFSMTSEVKLDLSGTVPMLTINFNNRRARLFQDTYSATSLQIGKTMPADLSRIYICSDERVSTGNNICLGTSGTIPAMVNWNSGATSYTSLNDFASSTVRIPLTDTALNTILAWGTSQFYLRCENGAFRDLWGNLSEPFADSNNNGALIETVMPSGSEFAEPKIYSVALTPVVEGLAGRTLFKGHTANTFMYEVSFETATLSSNIRVPIAQNVTPTLKLYTQNGDSLIDSGTFVEWGEHNQGGVSRTYVRFANSGLSEAGTFQREPVYVKVEGFTDIFRATQSFEDTASFSYDLTKKMEGTAYPTGFNQVASYPMEFDNCAPTVLTATSTVANVAPVDYVVGVASKNNVKVVVTFSENMFQSTNTSAMPALKLVTSAGATVMPFTFSRWQSPTEAEYLNAADFDSNTTQGKAYFMISGGYDEAGNALADVTLADYLDIKSKGPTINSIIVKTLQYTTANSADDYQTNVAYSPSVSSNYYEDTVAHPYGMGEGLGVATITVTFDSAPEGNTGEIRIYTIDGATLVRRLDAVQASSATEWYAEWDGRRDDGTLITSNYQITYLIKFFDAAGNEGSRTGQIVYDNSSPKVIEWQFPNLKVVNNIAYFSPSAQSSARINVITGDLGQTMKMRLSRKNPDPAQHDIINTYVMSSYGNSGYTIAFDGNGSVSATEALVGSWAVDLVDTAGNIGVGLNASSKPVATLYIDRTAPNITNITLQKVTADLTPVGDPGIDRFNARLNNLKIMIVDSTVADDPLDDGTGIVKIMSGNTVLREIFTVKTGSDLYAVWDGNDDNGAPVPDGTYTIKVSDLAGNEGTLTKEVTLIRSVFSLTGVEQVGLDSIKMVFSQKVEPTTIGAAYTISPINPPGLQISNATLSSSDATIVMASITPALTVNQHNIEYTVTVPADTVKSIDGDSITAGNNTAKFTADTKGPSIVAITYDGLNSQKQFNVVFDEQVESGSAITVANYKLAIGGTDVPITSVVLRADNKSVTITSSSDIEEGTNYTLTVKDVKDLSGNKSDTNITFEGRDITPPVLIITAFSTPANVRDIVIAVKANEDISGLPTAVISQTGTVANSIQLVSTGNNRIFTGGYHLDSNYAGVATIKVTATDLSNNVGTGNYSFTTAYVSSSARASITSADKVATVVFEKGSLKSNSTVMFMTEQLVKIENASDTAVRASIIPAVSEGMNTETRASLRATIDINAQNDKVVQELTPFGDGYKLIVPTDSLTKSVNISMKLSDEQLAATNAGLYEYTNNTWKLVKTSVASGTARFSTKDGSLFAVMKDTMAPRASITNDLTKVIKTSKPVFTWNITEYASGIDKNNIKAVLDGKEYDVMLSKDGTVAKFTPPSLNTGEHELGINVIDLAGNRASIDSGRFTALISLVIEDVSSYPNPAKNYSKIRFKVSGNQINADEVSVKIYDVAGHLVADASNIDMRGGKANIYEARWDLRNKKGKKVANGAYIARIEVRDPINWGKKAKYTLKIAVLK